MRSLLWVLSALILATRIASAQAIDEPEISVGGFEVAANGAERAAGIWRTTGPLIMGKPTVGVFSTLGCGYFTVTVPPKPFEEKATAGWRVEVTPIKIVEHAVTFRLRWVRALDNSGALTSASEDVELTLRPGESRPIDSVPVAQTAKTFDGRVCDKKEVSLRVRVNFSEALDSRLIGAEMWLVERLANGKEQSQPLTVRGLPHHDVPFYFDGVGDGADRVDIFGTMVPEPEQGGIRIALETIRAKANSNTSGYHAAYWSRSTVHLKPDEIVDVALPQLTDDSSPFAKRVFSVRIRAKMIR